MASTTTTTTNNNNTKFKLGIYWDIENCPVPGSKSPSSVVKSIRQFIKVTYPEYGYPSEFLSACDARKLDKHVSDGLNLMGVTIVHVDSLAKNAADDKLKISIDKFIDQSNDNDDHHHGNLLVIITGDINFSNCIQRALTKQLRVVVLYGSGSYSQSLIDLVDESYCYDKVIQSADPIDRKMVAKKLNKAYLRVTNLPDDRQEREIFGRLSQLVSNCGGKPTKYGNGRAWIRFACKQDAERAIQRCNGEDCFGRKINVQLMDNNSNDNSNHNKTTNNNNQEKYETNKSIITGLSVSNDNNCVDDMVRKMVTDWDDQKLDPNSLIVSTLVQENGSLIVTASSVDSNNRLIAGAKRYLLKQDKSKPKISWLPFRESDKPSDLKAFIRGLYTKNDDNCTEIVRKIVDDWADNQVTRDYVTAVIRTAKADGRIKLLVTTDSRQRRDDLLEASSRHPVTGIEWIECSPEHKKWSDDCKSVISGLETTSDCDPLEVVRQLVTDWSDSSLDGQDLVRLVSRDGNFRGRDGRALLFVTASSREANQALVNGARKYWSADSCRKWSLYNRK
ncbi:uncharacterized protein LOC128966470 [Oppia nitens]|uniref:uncharacterized protein LOC128966470 n=1 Tax=Oppia nitens TaxID=1686743 RepID=UPI0023DB124F|nr:uncharacterized protein LOC128966470 [Oppia nitens]